MKNPLLGRQNATLSIRLHKKDLRAIKAKARESRMSLSDYVKDSCLTSTKKNGGEGQLERARTNRHSVKIPKDSE